MANLALSLGDPVFHAHTAAGAPLSGGKLYTYAAGTVNTTKATWQDGEMTVPNANPIILDTRGEAKVFGIGSYYLVLTNSADNPIWEIDYLFSPELSPYALELLDDNDAAAAQATMELGTAAALDVGTAGSKVVQLTAQARLPAVDGSLLTNTSASLYSHLYNINGLDVSRISTTAFSVAKGNAEDATGAFNMILTAAITKGLGAWAEGSGAAIGSLDTGAAVVVSSWYHVFLIYEIGVADYDVVISLGLTPAMPTGYDYYRMVGSIYINSSSQIADF